MNVLSIAASGLQAAQNLLGVAADNIANANTPGYLARRADLADISTGGVAVEGISTTGQGVDLASQITDLKQAQVMYGANAMVVKVADQMYGSLLDIFDSENRNSDSNNT